jgi:hypothetical protein
VKFSVSFSVEAKPTSNSPASTSKAHDMGSPLGRTISSWRGGGPFKDESAPDEADHKFGRGLCHPTGCGDGQGCV